MSKNRQFGFGLALAWLAFLVCFHTPIRQRKSPGVSLFFLILWDACEKPSKMTKFLKRQKVSFPIHHDVNHTLIESLKVKTMPSAFLVDQDGMIHSVHEGFHEKTSGKAYRKAIESLLKKR